jgi:hypothetical protein
LLKRQSHNAGALRPAEFLDIDRRINVFAKVRVEVEVRDGTAIDIRPQLQCEFPSVSGEGLLPDGKLRSLAVDDDPIEIKDQRFDHPRLIVFDAASV